jgi:integrase
MIRASGTPLDLAAFLDREYVPSHINLSHGAAEQLRIAVRLLESWYRGPVPLSLLDRNFLIDWMRWLSKDRAPATVNRKRGAVYSVWSYAAELGLCHPPGRIPRLNEPQRIPVTWSLEEVDRIFAACGRLTGEWSGVPVSLCWKICLLVFWDTGCRLGTTLKAELRHVDLRRGLLFAPAENIKGRRRDRLFRLHAQTVAMIGRSLPSDRKLLFPFPWVRKQVWYHLRKILVAAGLPADRSRMFHCIRRTAESYAAAERGIQWAADAVGHTVDVARRSYVSPLVAPGPALIEALPRPQVR